MAQERGHGSSSEKIGVESFVWRESSSSKKHRPCWTIRYRKSSGIYDSDPHSLKVPRSHNAWKKELMMTRFANQELPEAVWGDNFLEISYGSSSTNSKDRNSKTDTNPPCGVRISFYALEALRTWALMDMGVEGEVKNGQGENSNPIDENVSNKAIRFRKQTNNMPTIIPHKSGQTPDPWDYTYTTNYSGSVECISPSSTSNSNGSFDAKQPDRTTLYAVRVSMSQESSTQFKPQTGIASSATTLDKSTSYSMGGFSSTTTAVLRPPMCKCVGGRMICAGVAQTLMTGRPQRKALIRVPNPKKSERSSLECTNTTSFKTPPSKPSPKWMPYCSENDGPFDMEALLNSQTSAPLHYTGTIPFWIQNLDPQSYSFLTVTAVVCRGNNSGAANDGGFVAILQRCFVRVNGVRVRLIDTKFIIRRKRTSESSKQNSSQSMPMVILRERSWKEGSWKEYTAGMKGMTDGNYHFLGTDLEQGRRASKMLPHRFPPTIEKLVIYDNDNGYGNCNQSNEKNTCVGSNKLLETFVPDKLAVAQEEWTIPALQGKIITNCASGSGILVLVVEKCKLMIVDALTGEYLWEYSLAPLTVLSLAVHLDHHSSSSSHRDKAEIIVGDDRGCAHVIKVNGVNNTKREGEAIISKQSYCFQGSNEGNRQTSANIQRPSNWVEKVIWSASGSFFAAAAGKKVMINGEVLEMDSTVYDLAFLPTSKNADSNTGGEELHCPNPVRQLLAIALYGGLIIVDATTTKIWNRQFNVGSSAVLSLAISPNGRSIGIGCLDKRLRVFEMAETAGDTGGSIGRNGIDSWEVHDWIGMDGGVTRVAFGPDNRRLAALGGSILFVIDRTSEWGEAPIICSLHQDREQRSGRVCRYRSFAWNTKDILVASTDRFLHMFDVRATIDTVPKRLYPFASVPVENDFLITKTGSKIIEWGKSGIRKINLTTPRS